MIIILEGPDGTGKTTLSKWLSNRLNCPVYKPAMRDGLSLDSRYKAGHDSGSFGVALELAGRADMIMDRSYPSAIAYSEAFDRDEDLSEAWELDSRAFRSGSVMGFLFTGTYDIAEQRGVNDVSRASWERIAMAYELFAEGSALDWHVVNSAVRAPNQMLEAVMSRIIESRDTVNSKDRVFMEMARNAARRSTCLSRRNGAVLVSESGHVIAVGYNGAPAGFPHQRTCERLCSGYRSGGNLDACNDVHSEENCIVHASLSGASPKGGTIYTLNSPCPRCARMLVNARVSRVVYENPYDKGAMEMMREVGIDVEEL